MEDFRQNDAVRVEACWKLRDYKAKSASTALFRAMRDPSSELRSAAFAVLREVGVDDELLNPLITLLDDGNEINRFRAAELIGKLGPKGKPAVPKLIEMLKADPTSGVAGALGEIGPNAAEAVPILISRLQPRSRALPAIIGALDKIAPEDARVIPVLVQLLEPGGPPQPAPGFVVTSPDVGAVIRAIARRGSRATAALPTLRKLSLGPYAPETKSEAERATKAILAAAGNKTDVAAIDQADVDKSLKVVQDSRRTLDERTTAIRNLGFYTNAAPKIVPALSKCAADQRELPDLRRTSVYALTRFGAVAVPALDRIMRLEDRTISSDAASALTGIAPDGIKTLVNAMKDSNPRVRGHAVQALQSAKPPAEGLLPQLKDMATRGNSDTKIAALTLLSTYTDSQHTAELSDIYIRAMIDADQGVRTTARNIFANLNPQFDDKLAEKAAKLLKDSSADVRLAAVSVVARAQGEAYVPRLIETAQSDSDPRVRLVATNAIRTLRPAVSAQLDLDRDVKNLTDAKATAAMRAEAMLHLSNVPALPPAAIPALIAVLSDKDPRMRGMAAEILGNQGSAAKSAAGALARLRQDPDPNVRARAGKALSQVGAPTQLPVDDLIKQLASGDSSVRKAAAKALGSGGASSARAMVALERLAREDANARQEAIEAMRWIEDGMSAAGGPRRYKFIRSTDDATGALKSPRAEDREDAINYLQSYSREPVEQRMKLIASNLQDKQSRVRRAAAAAMRQFRRQASAAAPQLLALVDDWEPRVRQAAFEALSEIAPDDDRVIANMVSQLKSPYAENRRSAASVLRFSGIKGKQALSALREVTSSDADTGARQAARDAILEIEKAK